MIIRIFQSGYFVRIFILFASAVVLWIPAFLQPAEIFSAGMSGIAYDFIGNPVVLPQHVVVALAFMLLMVQAIVFNAVLIENPFFSKAAFLPAFIYVILMSHHPDYLTLHPVLIANFFLMFSLKNLFNTYGKSEAYRETFNASFWVAAASLFYFPAVFFITFIWAVFIIFRIAAWREWLISFIGFFMPYLILLIFFFLADHSDAFIKYFVQKLTWVAPTIDLKLPDFIFWPVFILLLLYAWFKFTAERSNKIIQIRKSFSVLNILLIISGLSLILSGRDTHLHAFLIFPAASAIIAFYFIESGKKWLSEMLFALVLLAVVVIKFL